MSDGNLRTEWAAEDAMPDGKHVEVHYDSAQKDYWIKNSRGGRIRVTETSLRRILMEAGYRSKRAPGEPLSELDRKLVEIQRNSDVAYAGPLAGHPIGVTEIHGNRILVTSSPRLIEPKAGDWSTISALLENLFDDPRQDQRPYFCGWLKIAVETLRERRIRPGQALALAGVRSSGKSLLQKLITEVLGNRAAKPYRYMCDKTTFNGELFGAEHQMIEDEIGSTDMRTRRMFGARIKEFTVNEVHSCHPKNRQAMSLTPFWRLTISLNEEPENLGILPPIDESLEDKIILLKARKRPMPMPTNTLAERKAFWQRLLDELPAFLHYLSEWEIPADLRCDRFGIKHYHHPELLAAIDGMAHETRLLALIDEFFWPLPDEAEKITAKPPESLRITAEQLQLKLTGSEFNFEARRLLNWPNATGTYLGRLATKHPGRVQQERKAQSRIWVIQPPPNEGSGNEPGAGSAAEAGARMAEGE